MPSQGWRRPPCSHSRCRSFREAMGSSAISLAAELPAAAGDGSQVDQSRCPGPEMLRRHGARLPRVRGAAVRRMRRGVGHRHRAPMARRPRGQQRQPQRGPRWAAGRGLRAAGARRVSAQRRLGLPVPSISQPLCDRQCAVRRARRAAMPVCGEARGRRQHEGRRRRRMPGQARGRLRLGRCRRGDRHRGTGRGHRHAGCAAVRRSPPGWRPSPSRRSRPACCSHVGDPAARRRAAGAVRCTDHDQTDPRRRLRPPRVGHDPAHRRVPRPERGAAGDQRPRDVRLHPRHHAPPRRRRRRLPVRPVEGTGRRDQRGRRGPS